MYSTEKSIVINNRNLIPKEINSQRVVTFKDVDELHERPTGTAKRNFNENKEYFIEGEDFYKICADEIRTNKIMDISPKTHQDIVFLTEFGYLMLVKSLTDKLAWQVQRQLVNGYFRAKSSATIPSQYINPLLEQAVVSLQTSQQHIIDCTMEHGYQLQDHEKKIDYLCEKIEILENSIGMRDVDLRDEIKSNFEFFCGVINHLRVYDNQSVDKDNNVVEINGKDLIRNTIKPLGEKLNDHSLGYKSTYKKVYLAMNLNWKYRITRWNNLNDDNKVFKKIDLVAEDVKLLELFKDTVTKLLQD